MQIKTKKLCYYTIKLSKMWKSNSSKFWRRCGEIGTLIATESKISQNCLREQFDNV